MSNEGMMHSAMKVSDINVLESRLKRKRDALSHKQEILQKLSEELEKLIKTKKRWRTFVFIELLILLIILLYSCSIFLFGAKNLNVYSAVYSAEMISVDKDTFSSMTSDDILRESIENDYVSNCMEFYYDPDDKTAYDIKMSDTVTRYYSVDDLNKAIVGQKLNYKLSSLEKTADWTPSETVIANRVFSYGLRDGSSQMAYKESENLVFNGYSAELIRRYMQDVSMKLRSTQEDAVALVVEGDYEVTDEMVNAIVAGVFDDAYMANGASYRRESTTTDKDFYYGLKESKGRIYYVKSHATSYDTDLWQKPEEVDVTDLLVNNLKEYLGKNVKVSTKVPEVPRKKTTVIYLSTTNYAYDNFYIADANGAY